MSSEHDAGDPTRKGLNRRSFLHTSGGVATGIAVTVLPTGVVALAAPAADAKEPAATARRPGWRRASGDGDGLRA